ncbi:MAG: 3-hydroxyacyl-CoA dehydrogenase NAD-binding domain-containing protein [Sphingomonadales bacterium]
MSYMVGTEIRRRVAVITVDNPPVNALSRPVRQGIHDAILKARADDAVDAMVLICTGRTFMAGADIREFGKPPASPDLRTVIGEIENADKPVIAAIHGAALETALGCHYRCAVATARVGVPEVKLGLLPGAGGTQRLPRLIGIKAALDMIVSGNPTPAATALDLGLIDHIVEGDLLEGAVVYAEKLVRQGAAARRIRDMAVDATVLDEDFLDNYRQAIARKTRGYFAPERCIQAVEAAISLPFDEGLAHERALFVECMQSTASAALRHVFFAEREAAHIPDVPGDTPKRRIETAAVLGAGTMGGGIAMNFANAGIPVTILEIEEQALDRGLALIGKNYQATRDKGRLSQAQVDECMGLITGTLDYGDLADADIVIEAVFENMAIKKQVFGKLDAVCKPGAILATNTSTLDIDEIAAVTSRPGDVIGTHFFSPANVMKLLEVVRGERTERQVIATTMKLAKTLAKIPVLARVCYGFIGNRMLEGYGREAGLLLLEGATPEQVDKALYDFGMPMGPFAMSDLAGVDVSYRVRQERKNDLPDDERHAVIGDRLFERGRYGQKTGSGYFRYEPGSRTPISDPEVHALIEREAARLGIERRPISDDEIVKRCIYPIINEGARVLEDGIALRPGDIDVVWVHGYGFPAYRGGPMFYADTVGLGEILNTLRAYRDIHGDYWEPAPLLEKLAGKGQGFSDPRSADS